MNLALRTAGAALFRLGWVVATTSFLSPEQVFSIIAFGVFSRLKCLGVRLLQRL